MAGPAILDFIFEVQLAPNALGKPVVPLLGVEVLAQPSEVEHRDRGLLLAQAGGGPHHER